MVTAILKLFKGADVFFWHVDQDIIAFTVKKILVDQKLQLLGFPIPGGIYIGPAFYYLAAGAFVLVFKNPLNLYLITAVIGILTTFLVYKIGRTIFENERIGILAAIIYGFSSLVNIYFQNFSGLTFAPILALFTYLILYQNIKFKKPSYLLILGLILTLAVQNEGSSFSLIVLALVSFSIYRFKVPLKKFVGIVLIFILFHVPLLIFDLRHNFFVLKSLTKFWSERTVAGIFSLDFNNLILSLEIFPRTFSRLVAISGEQNVSDQILPCADLATLRISQISPIVFIFVTGVIGYFAALQLRKKKIVIGGRIVFFHFLILIFGLIIYNFFFSGYLFEWTLVIFFPAFAFILAYFLNDIYKKFRFGNFLVKTMVVGFLLINVRSMLVMNDNYGLANKAKAVRYALNEISRRSFFFDSIGSCYAQGYLFLFWYFGQMPDQLIGAMIDPNLIPKPLDQKPHLGVVFVNPSKKEGEDFYKRYNLYKQITVSSNKIDDIEILIVEDK